MFLDDKMVVSPSFLRLLACLDMGYGRFQRTITFLIVIVIAIVASCSRRPTLEYSLTLQQQMHIRV
jgi:hypothetical protein